MFKIEASTSSAELNRLLTRLLKPPEIEIEPIVYEAIIPELISSSAAPSNSISCLPAEIDKSSFTATETP